MKSIVNRFTTFIESWPLRIAVVLSLLSLTITPVLAECLRDNGDGTHTDPTTGLIWQTCALGQTWNSQKCIGDPEQYAWEKSFLAADENRFLNKDDWILPTREQLGGLFKTECGLMDKRRFWSSSPFSGSPLLAYDMDFSRRIASDSGRYAKYYVRLVRGSMQSDTGVFKESLTGFMEKQKTKIIEQSKTEFEASVSSSELKSFIATYEGNDPGELIPSAKKKLVLAEKREAAEARARELQAYRDAFRSAQSSSSLDSFISSYRGNDPDKLIPKAEAKKRVALVQERKEAERQRREDEYRREHACDHLYVGKVVNAPVTGLVSLFGIKSEKAIVLGFSNRNGVATVRSVDNSSMVGEVSCDSLQ